MGSQISRRSFLKLLSTLTLVPFLSEKPHSAEETNSTLAQNQDTPNVLVLVFDTLSARHMSLYGYHRETTPNLARFAERATVFHNHYSAGNFTTPGTASILTGTYPWSHRAFHLYGTVAKNYQKKNLFSVIGAGEAYHRIAYTHNNLVNQLLHQFGENLEVLKKTSELCLFYENLISDQMLPNDHNVSFLGEIEFVRGNYNNTSTPSSLFLSIVHRIWRSTYKKDLSKKYSYLFPKGLPSFPGNPMFYLLEHAIDWIEAQLSSLPQPFLGYFHLLPPHDPYAPRREFVNLFNDGWSPPAKKSHFFSIGYPDRELNTLRREYDEYIAYADAEFGRLFDCLAQTGVLDNTYVVFTSDHGEMFERGIFAHITQTLYEPIIHVPLLISKPGQRQREDVYIPTSCVDLLPTLLYATNQAIPDWCEGEVLPTFRSQDASSQRSIFSIEAKSNPKQASLTKRTMAIIKDRYKLIHYLGYDGYENEYELYDLANDPEEMEDLYLFKKPIATNLQNELAEKLQAVNQPYHVNLR